MKQFTVLTIVILLLSLTATLYGAGTAITGIGTRATAMGGNYRAIADDWSAMYWNPAGITQLKGMNFGASLLFIDPVANYLFSQNVPQFSLFNTDEIESKPKSFKIPSGGFVYRTGKMSFGLSLYAPFGLGTEWDAMITDTYNTNYPAFEYQNNFKVITVQPTIAYQMNHKLSLGLGIGIVYSDVILRKPMTTPNPIVFDDANELLRNALTLYNLSALTSEHYNHILTEQKLTGNGYSFGLNFGIKFDLSKDISIGLSAVYYRDVPLKGKINVVTYGAQVDPALYNGLSVLLDGIAELDEVTKQQILAIYDGKKHVTYSSATVDTDMPLPVTIGGGICYKGIRNLLISTDLSWTKWSSWDVLKIEVEDGSTFDLNQKWKSGLRFGLGSEYQFTDCLAIQAGYYTEPSAIPEQTLSIAVPDINRYHVLNIGTSYCIGLIKMYASYEKIIIGDREVKNWTYNPNTQSYDNMAGVYKVNVSTFMFGMEFNF